MQNYPKLTHGSKLAADTYTHPARFLYVIADRPAAVPSSGARSVIVIYQGALDTDIVVVTFASAGLRTTTNISSLQRVFMGILMYYLHAAITIITK